MINLVSISYIVAVTAFFAGTFIVGNLLVDSSIEEHKNAFAGLLIIPIFALFSYAAMAFGIGFITINSITVSIPRYVNWIVTIPVIVSFVGYVANASRKLIISVIISSIVSILIVGYAAVLVTPIKWVLFNVSLIISISIIAIIYILYPKYVTKRRRRLFEQLQKYIIVIWIGYPLIWIASPAGLEFISFKEFSIIASYLDIIAKVPFLYFIWSQRHTFRNSFDKPLNADQNN